MLSASALLSHASTIWVKYTPASWPILMAFASGDHRRVYDVEGYGVQVLHSINLHQLDLIHSMDSYVDTTVMPILKDVKTMWQPTDFLPDSSSPDFLDQV